MIINFRKLKKQIFKWKPESKSGYIFIPTMEQEDNFIFSVATMGSKRNLIKAMIHYIKIYPEYKEEFTL